MQNIFWQTSVAKDAFVVKRLLVHTGVLALQENRRCTGKALHWQNQEIQQIQQFLQKYNRSNISYSKSNVSKISENKSKKSKSELLERLRLASRERINKQTKNSYWSNKSSKSKCKKTVACCNGKAGGKSTNVTRVQIVRRKYMSDSRSRNSCSRHESEKNASVYALCLERVNKFKWRNTGY